MCLAAASCSLFSEIFTADLLSTVIELSEISFSAYPFSSNNLYERRQFDNFSFNSSASNPFFLLFSNSSSANCAGARGNDRGFSFMPSSDAL